MNILFAPDYSRDNPYQNLLASALQTEGSKVHFLSQYKRGLPLSRGLASSAPKPDLMHLHWPEPYMGASASTLTSWLRAIRHPLDLWALTRKHPLVITAHNLLPHKRTPLCERNMRATYKAATHVIAHSDAAGEAVCQAFQFPANKITVIPHGDLATSLPAPTNRLTARATLNLDPDHHLALMFGALSPYKGIEEVATAWEQTSSLDAHLHIVGDSFDKAYGDALERHLQPMHKVSLTRQRVDDRELSLWLQATDCTIFNYTRILTSGCACLARSLGVPIVLPERLDTIDLNEPHPSVFRFQSITDMPNAAARAMATPRSENAHADWVRNTAWSTVAKRTQEVYQKCA